MTGQWITVNLGNLLPDERYAVVWMREHDTTLHLDIHGGTLLYSGNVPVCTIETMFRLLGNGVCRRYETGNYGLVEAWRVDRESGAEVNLLPREEIR
jgi:hypothetical protein